MTTIAVAIIGIAITFFLRSIQLLTLNKIFLIQVNFFAYFFVMNLNIFFKFLTQIWFGINAINDYYRLKIRVVCVAKSWCEMFVLKLSGIQIQICINILF